MDATGQYYRAYSVPAKSRSELRALPGLRTVSVSSEWPPYFYVFRAQMPSNTIPRNNNWLILPLHITNERWNVAPPSVSTARPACGRAEARQSIVYLSRNGCCARGNVRRAVLEYRALRNKKFAFAANKLIKKTFPKTRNAGVLLVIIVTSFLDNGLYGNVQINVSMYRDSSVFQP